MRFFLINDNFTELTDWPKALPAHGFLWVTTSRRVFEVQLPQVQQHLHRLAGGTLVDLHISDLLNPQLPSQYDYTSWYDLLVFRRLAAGHGTERLFLDEERGTASSARQAMAAIDTSPVGFALFDRVLLTVHPADCSVRDFFEARLSQMIPHPPRQDAQDVSVLAQGPSYASAAAQTGSGLQDAQTDDNALPPVHDHGLDNAQVPRHEGRGSTSRLPPNPADLMLRIVNHMVDSYLDLRRLLTKQFGYLQQELLSNRNQFTNWQALLDSRNTLHMLEDTCEDQRSAVQEMPLLTTKYGFEPWYLEQLTPELRAEAESFLKEQEARIAALECSEEIRQYYVGMGYTVAVVMSCSLPSAVYIAELRAADTVHPTLRVQAQRMGDALKQAVPGLAMHHDTSPGTWNIKRGSQDIVRKEA